MYVCMYISTYVCISLYVCMYDMRFYILVIIVSQNILKTINNSVCSPFTRGESRKYFRKEGEGGGGGGAGNKARVAAARYSFQSTILQERSLGK